MLAHRSSQPGSTTRAIPIWTLCGTVALCVAMFVGLHLVMAPRHQAVHAVGHAAEAGPAQWEHARLRVANDVRGLTPGPRVRANSLGDLIERLGGKPPADEDGISPAEVLLDKAGAEDEQSCHMSWCRMYLFGGWTTLWTFKRSR